MRKLTLLTILIIVNLKLTAQYVLGKQSFESSSPSNNMTYKITGSGGLAQGYTGMSPTGYYVSNSPFYTDGTVGYGLCGTTRIIDFDPVSTTGYSNIKLSFNLSAFATTASQGLDVNDGVTVSISTDGITYYDQVVITGRNNAYWSYTAQGSATRTFSTSDAAITARPSGSVGEHNIDGISYIELNSLPSNSRIYTRITMTTTAAEEMWVVDNIKMTADLTLPVEMTSFKVNNDGSENILTWTTATEDNVASYIIERGKTANNFEQIGSTNAIGAGDYYFIDKSPLQGVCYYRIKVVDHDGSISYSKIVSTYIRENQWELYPTLATSEINVARVSTDNDGMIEVFDNIGRKVLTQKVQGGDTNLTVNLSQLPRGQYFMLLDEKVQRFTKL